MRCIGIDWGSSSRRAYALDEHGRLLAQRADHAGVLNKAATASPRDFGAELADFIGDWLQQGPRHIWLSGMVGSRTGWHEAPYLTLPCALGTLGAQALTLAWPAGLQWTATPPTVRLLPGLCQRPPQGTADVMRGEETQLLGAWHLHQAQHASEGGGVFLMPGTHSKWVRLCPVMGRVLSFRTFMTGELYELLSRQGALGGVIQGASIDIDDEIALRAFDEGLRWAGEDSGLAALFRVRAQGLLSAAPAAQARVEAAARLSGLLIGGEMACVASDEGQGLLRAIGEPGLCVWYARAASHFGLQLQIVNPVDCYLAALQALENLAP